MQHGLSANGCFCKLQAKLHKHHIHKKLTNYISNENVVINVLHVLPANSSWHSHTLEYFCRYAGRLPFVHTLTTTFCTTDTGLLLIIIYTYTTHTIQTWTNYH